MNFLNKYIVNFEIIRKVDFVSEKEKNLAQQTANNTIKFEGAVFFVKDINLSKNFYENILDQKIIMDFGVNIGFEGGFAIWEAEYAIQNIFSQKAEKKPLGRKNTELYFESTNLDDIYQKLEKEGIEFIHSIREQPWGQKGFRFYDPDRHIIEIGEPMYIVVIRYHQEGMKLEEIAKKTLMPIEIIKKILRNIPT